jgi:hypothetical protein
VLTIILAWGGIALLGQQGQNAQPTNTPTAGEPSTAPSSKQTTGPHSAQTEKTDQRTSGKAAPQTPPAKDAAPFPEAQSEAAAKAKAQASQEGKTAHDNPFPEAESEAAARQNGADQGADQGPPVSKQPLHLSPLPGTSSSNANLSPRDLGETVNKHERQDEYTQDKSPEGRIKNDLQVADFYMKNWNYRGASMRYKDALAYDPYNETALFGSAQAACKMNMAREAMEQYKLYLQQYPNGKYAKDAGKMLRRPDKCANNR